MALKIEAAKRLHLTAAAVTGEDVDDMSEADLVRFVSKASPAELKKLMFPGGRGGCQVLFPSGWAYTCTDAPYPAKLAQILVASKAQESVTDLANSFYNKKRKMEPEAMQVFLKSVLSLKPNALAQQLSGGEATNVADLPGSNLCNGLEIFAKNQPAMLKQILMKLPEKTRAALVEETHTDPAIVKLLK